MACHRWQLAKTARMHTCRSRWLKSSAYMCLVCAGGPLGSGKQWLSWIHRDDLVDLMIDSIKNSSYSGVYNGTAPKPVTMAQLCSSVGGVMGRPSWLPVPDFAITTLLGEGAQVCGRHTAGSGVGGALPGLAMVRQLCAGMPAASKLWSLGDCKKKNNLIDVSALVVS